MKYSMLDKIKHKFLIQRWHAVNKRNIAWNLTFEEWFDIWEQSGKFDQRGKGKGKYCMARKNDSGPYEVGNVYITLFEQNNIDQHTFNEPKIGKHNSKKVITPLGIFNSRDEAAKAHNILPNQMGGRIKRLEGYSYA